MGPCTEPCDTPEITSFLSLFIKLKLSNSMYSGRSANHCHLSDMAPEK